MLAALAAGGALPLDTLSGDPGRLLVIFLGLVSASILPTISLILSSMTASGRSVHALNELQLELTAAMDALFLLFGLVGVAVITLLALTIPTPPFFAEIPFLAAGLQRSGQALVAAASTLIVMRSGQIPGILRRSLNIRHKIAVEEARRKTNEAAPEQGAVKAAFPTHPEFGKAVDLADLQERDPH
ncbi:MAG: hypothetical protein H0X36_01760 [Sphingomonadaceae bacterium]|nr:hypothetical protein [Sphingomonadaceae bacterium]